MSDLLDVGDEVICIDDSKPNGWSQEDFPQWVVKDKTYVIREILHNDDIVAGVLLVELKNPLIFQKLLNRFQEPAFATWRFSKLRSAYEIAEEKKAEEMAKKDKIGEGEVVERTYE
jgi:hypothetical protein